LTRRTPWSALSPYTTLFRSHRRPEGTKGGDEHACDEKHRHKQGDGGQQSRHDVAHARSNERDQSHPFQGVPVQQAHPAGRAEEQDRKSTRLNSSHVKISYAV